MFHFYLGFFLLDLGFIGYYIIGGEGMKRSFIGDFFLCVLIGVGFAGLMKYLYDNGIWLDQYITGSTTIEEFMFIVVLIWVLVGLIVSLMRR